MKLLLGLLNNLKSRAQLIFELFSYLVTRLHMRIMIFGHPGSGKTSFSLKLNQQLGIPVYHLDKYFFTKNWESRPEDEFLDDLQTLVAKTHWIIDGNALGSLEVRYKKADLAICFLYPRWLCLWRIFKRRFTKDITISDRAFGCPEVISWKLIKYMWTLKKRLEPIILRLQVEYPDIPLQRLHNDREADAFLYKITKKGPTEAGPLDAFNG